MVIERENDISAVICGLQSSDWLIVLNSVEAAQQWIRSAPPGNLGVEQIVQQLVRLANHTKWEVRRAIANAAARSRHPAFEQIVRKLLTDDNARVRQAAEQASLRRRDWRNSSTLGKQHEERVNVTLEGIEARFGTRGRDSVKRASEQIANTFARELYHEVIKLLSPLALSADRLKQRLLDTNASRDELVAEAVRIEQRVTQLRAILDAMRAYTAQPELRFTHEDLKDIVEEAACLAIEGSAAQLQAKIENRVPLAVAVDVSRPRLVQALTNILTNALESYENTASTDPVVVGAVLNDGTVSIKVQDAGCGMSPEALADAITLFATSKREGTGFGLPLAVKIIESEHEGRLTIESGIDAGTVVRIDLPLYQGDTDGSALSADR